MRRDGDGFNGFNVTYGTLAGLLGSGDTIVLDGGGGIRTFLPGAGDLLISTGGDDTAYWPGQTVLPNGVGNFGIQLGLLATAPDAAWLLTSSSPLVELNQYSGVHNPYASLTQGSIWLNPLISLDQGSEWYLDPFTGLYYDRNTGLLYQYSEWLNPFGLSGDTYLTYYDGRWIPDLVTAAGASRITGGQGTQGGGKGGQGTQGDGDQGDGDQGDGDQGTSFFTQDAIAPTGIALGVGGIAGALMGSNPVATAAGTGIGALGGHLLWKHLGENKETQAWIKDNLWDGAGEHMKYIAPAIGGLAGLFLSK